MMFRRNFNVPKIHHFLKNQIKIKTLTR